MTQEVALAHSPNPDGHPQPRVDHLRAVAAFAAACGSKFGAPPRSASWSSSHATSRSASG